MTTAGRRSGGGFVICASPSMGRCAKPRTFTECTRARGPRRPRRAHPATSSSSTTRASSRARLAPRQKCRPLPKLSSSAELLLVAVDVVRVGVGEHPLVAVGRPEQQQQLRPRRGDAPCSSTSPWQVRASIWLEASKRSVSSIHGVTRSVVGVGEHLGLLRRGARPSNSALPSSLVVVSLPATTMRNRNANISSSVRRSPSISTSSSAEVRSSVGCRRRSASCRGSRRSARATRRRRRAARRARPPRGAPPGRPAAAARRGRPRARPAART